MRDIITVTRFSDFIAELDPGPGVAVRLCMSEVRSQGVPPSKRVTLDLQAINACEELVWLSESHRVACDMAGNVWGKSKSIYEAMHTLETLVRRRLEGLEYEVLPGRYVLPNDLEPINGMFDCVRWIKDEDNSVRVELVEDGGENDE